MTDCNAIAVRATALADRLDCLHCLRRDAKLETLEKLQIDAQLPGEVETKETAAFDVAALKAGQSIVWSVLNDRLDRRYDGVFLGSEAQIKKRAQEIEAIIVDLVGQRLLPLLKRIESNHVS